MGVGGGLRAKYMLPRFRIRDSIKFCVQSDHVLEKLNFDLLTPGSGDRDEQGSAGQNICYHVAAFMFSFNVICNMIMFRKS